MDVPLARLEEWMRRYYHAVDHDIGSSGVRDLSMGELAALCGFDLAQLAAMPLRDSECLGGTALRAVLADRWTGGDVDRVMVTHGSSEAIYIVMRTLLEPGDEVVVVDPAYQQLYDIAAGVGCPIVRWPLRRHDGFSVDLDHLRHLAASRPRMIVVNFPHNPTGVSLSPQEQRDLVAVAEEAGAWLVWDHAFGELTYDAPPLPLPLWYERTIAFGTFSKSYGLAGLRVGWCVGPPDLLARTALLRDYIALYVSPVLEFFAEHAVRHADRLVAMQRRHAQGNLAQLERWVAGSDGRARMRRPDGGVSAFVEFPGVADVTDLCRRMAEERRVLLVPGDSFGDRFHDHARLGFGGTTEALTAGLAALDALTAPVRA